MKEPQFLIAYSLIMLTAMLDAWVIYLVVYHGGMDKEAYAIVTGILGVWHIALAGAWGYWIGSSSGSQKKDVTIAAQATALSVKS